MFETHPKYKSNGRVPRREQIVADQRLYTNSPNRNSSSDTKSLASVGPWLRIPSSAILSNLPLRRERAVAGGDAFLLRVFRHPSHCREGRLFKAGSSRCIRRLEGPSTLSSHRTANGESPRIPKVRRACVIASSGRFGHVIGRSQPWPTPGIELASPFHRGRTRGNSQSKPASYNAPTTSGSNSQSAFGGSRSFRPVRPIR